MHDTVPPLSMSPITAQPTRRSHAGFRLINAYIAHPYISPTLRLVNAALLASRELKQARPQPHRYSFHLEQLLNRHTAADLLQEFPSGCLTVPKSFRKKAPEEAVLHYADLPEDAIRKQDGYRITTPLKTLLDVAASPLSPEHLLAATTDALRSGLVRHEDLEAAVAAAPPAVRGRF